jgi:hypothetical protein
MRTIELKTELTVEEMLLLRDLARDYETAAFRGRGASRTDPNFEHNRRLIEKLSRSITDTEE